MAICWPAGPARTLAVGVFAQDEGQASRASHSHQRDNQRARAATTGSCRFATGNADQRSFAASLVAQQVGHDVFSRTVVAGRPGGDDAHALAVVEFLASDPEGAECEEQEG